MIFVLDSNLINMRFLIRKYWWEKSLKLINVRRMFIRHLRVNILKKKWEVLLTLSFLINGEALIRGEGGNFLKI